MKKNNTINRLVINHSIVLLAIQLLSSTPLLATYDLDDTEGYQTHYNKLPSVEESDRLLNERNAQFTQLLEKTGEVVVKYGLEAHVGLRLIHNHFPVGENQVMVEEVQDVKGTPSLVTYAHNLDEAKEKKALPASWIFSGDKSEDALVFETSTDPAVHAGIQLLKDKPQFMLEMEDLLKGSNFHSLLSVALLKRDSLVAQENEVYLEINDANPQQSVVQLCKTEQKSQDILRTTWSFRGPHQVMCIPSIYCFKTHDFHVGSWRH